MTLIFLLQKSHGYQARYFPLVSVKAITNDPIGSKSYFPYISWSFSRRRPQINTLSIDRSDLGMTKTIVKSVEF